MAQLILTEQELTDIGFVKKEYPGDELNSKSEVFEIPVINGCIYYNPKVRANSWYLKTVIGKFSNHIHLDISKAPELFVVLSCFKTKFNLLLL